MRDRYDRSGDWFAGDLTLSWRNLRLRVVGGMDTGDAQNIAGAAGTAWKL
ncbi:MAG TPA: hypothetical protein VHY91_25065 [Pirellulales bacterium]|jgi:hypothetical protein|nr:hypothetical protein [Pirellulales bacterium]